MPLHVTPPLNGGSSNLIIPIPIAQASRPIPALKTGQFSNTTREDANPRTLDLSSFQHRSKSPTPSIMVHRVAFWSCFGLAVRFWQVGIEMRPFFNRSSLWAYPVYALGGASFGHWLQGVDDRQTEMLGERKRALLEKRARKAQRDAERGQEA